MSCPRFGSHCWTFTQWVVGDEGHDVGWVIFSPLRALTQEQSAGCISERFNTWGGGGLGLRMCPGRGYLWGPLCPPGTQRWQFVLHLCPTALAGVLGSPHMEVTGEGPDVGKGQMWGHDVASVRPTPS